VASVRVTALRARDAVAGRTAPKLQAKSRHQHIASLGTYVRLGEETSARVTSEHDPASHRRTR
jgi:hypothetical protein